MSAKMIIIDDHTGDEISGPISPTQASITLARDEHSLTWQNVNMTDDTWDELIKLVRDYLPNIEPTGLESGLADAGSPAASTADDARQAQELADADERARTQAIKRADDDAQRAQEQALAVRHADNVASAGSPQTQAQRKARSKATRAWWYALDARTLKALALPTPNRSVTLGKLPPAVVAAYDLSTETVGS
jgi:hypothetical protein